MSETSKHVMIVAGESSGDALGADLMGALAEHGVSVSGVGGPKMQAAGLSSLFPMAEIALMGLKEILPKLPHLFKLVDATVAHALAQDPDVMVLIDSPEFNHRVAKRVKKVRPDIPIICYVAPQVWAWRRGRARKMRGYFDAVMAFLPFEQEIFEAYGGPPCHFVGHPVINRLDALAPLPDFKAQHRINKNDVLLSVLPGSRFSEIKVLAPIFGQVIAQLARDIPTLKLALPVLPHTRDMVRELTASWAVTPIFIEDEAEKMAAFQASRAALSSCGTATLELGLNELPTIGAYKMGLFGAFLLSILQVPSTILPNLILDAPVMEEFLQGRCQAASLTPAIRRLLLDDGANEKCRHMLKALQPALSFEGKPPAARAAEITLSYLAST
jgi:lipid-A-disaccharide synthase